MGQFLLEIVLSVEFAFTWLHTEPTTPLHSVISDWSWLLTIWAFAGVASQTSVQAAIVLASLVIVSPFVRERRLICRRP